MTTPLGPATPPPGVGAPGANTSAHRVHLEGQAQVARLSLSPPLDAATLAELAHLLDSWHPTGALNVLVLDLTTCTGSQNTAGVESGGSKGMLDGRQGRVRERALTVAQERVLASLNRLSVPILGVAAGAVPPSGCVLLSACDLLLAADQTIFVREGTAGLAYHAASSRWGTTGALPERISAYQAYRQGIVNWLAPPGQLTAETARILALLLDKSAVALSLAKRAFSLSLSQPNEPEQALEKISELYLCELMQTPDALEGLHAFLEKRPPVWQNKGPALESQC